MYTRTLEPTSTSFVALVALLSGAAVTASAAPRPVSTGMVALVTELRAFMPAEGSGGYVMPTSEERAAFGAAISALVRGDTASAELALGPYPGFEVIDFHDTDSGRSYWAVVEKPPLARGWGFYFVDRAAERPDLVLEAPHPLADRDSELAAAHMVSELGPAAFLLAGAHRYADPAPSSDMAHVVSSVFEAVHEVVATSDRVVLQIHGFSAAGHQGYPELLLSSGTIAPGADAEALCADIRSGGVGCTLFTGVAYTDLGAQSNVQGAFVRRSFGPGHFLHFETAESVRDDNARVGVVTSAIARRWPTSHGSGGCAAAPPSLGIALAALGLWRRGRVFRSRKSGVTV